MASTNNHNTKRESPPDGFASTYAAGGWRAIDRRYGAKTSRLLEWLRLSDNAIKAQSDHDNALPARE